MRPAPSQLEDARPRSAGYPLRDQAIVEASDGVEEPTQPLDSVIEPPGPVRRRRRGIPNPWPALLVLVLLTAGLGLAYAATRHSGNSQILNGLPPAAASPHASTPIVPSGTTPTATPPPSTSTPARTVSPAKVTVPHVVGSSLPRAVAALKRAGLQALVSHVVSSRPNGQVVGQNPSGGADAVKGARVRLEVALQPPVAVPDVAGMRLLFARERLTAAHLLVSVRYVPSAQTPRTVVAQFPRAGKKVRRGTHVLVNVSSGGRRSGSAAVAVPDVIGEDESTATSDLRSAGFSVDAVDSPTSDPGEDGIVVDQDPSGGTKISGSSRVTVYVGRYSGD